MRIGWLPMTTDNTRDVHMAQMEIQVPDIGDFTEVTVIELMVKPGDTIAPEQSLITVESDKASMEIRPRTAAWCANSRSSSATRWPKGR
jgi:biotin carboxyl carrier protein